MGTIDLGLVFLIGFIIPSAEEAIRDGDADEKEMEKLPASGENWLGEELRGLGREKREKNNENGNKKASVEEMEVELTWIGLISHL